MKKLLLAAALAASTASVAVADTVLVYKCSSSTKGVYDGETDSYKDKSFLVIEVDDEGAVIQQTGIEYWTDDDGEKLYGTSDEVLSDLTVIDDGKSGLAVTARADSGQTESGDNWADAEFASGKLKSTKVGKEEKEDVPKSLKGTGFALYPAYFETSKTKYRLWSKATRVANDEEELAGEFDDAVARLITYLGDKGYDEY